MNQFTESHLKSWKSDYILLTQNNRMPINKEHTWMLGNKSGIICIYEDDEIVYLKNSKSIDKTLNEIVNVNKNNELIRIMLKIELGFSEKKIKQKIISNANRNIIKKILKRFEFSLISVDISHSEAVAHAFIIVCDPRYNGQTTNMNEVLDNIPEKKKA